MNSRYRTSAVASAVLCVAAAARAQSVPTPQARETSQPPAASASEPEKEATKAPATAPEVATGDRDSWKTTLYGFVEMDAMRDSTQSFGDSPGNSPLLRSDGSSPAYLPLGTAPLGVTYGSTHPRMIFTARNSR